MVASLLSAELLSKLDFGSGWTGSWLVRGGEGRPMDLLYVRVWGVDGICEFNGLWMEAPSQPLHFRPCHSAAVTQ
jgi:hypothetical protein